MSYPKYTPEQRLAAFWAKVDKSAGPDACWIWTATKTDGYGMFWWDGKMHLSHRISYQVAHGSCPIDLDVLHSCDNPSCVNPVHLSLGTHLQNMTDMIQKGRNTVNRGEHHGMHKLTAAQVAEIRELYAAGGIGTQRLGKRFGVSKRAVQLIVQGKHWKITMPR